MNMIVMIKKKIKRADHEIQNDFRSSSLDTVLHARSADGSLEIILPAFKLKTK